MWLRYLPRTERVLFHMSVFCFANPSDDESVAGNLMIKRVQKSDEGMYICRAEVNTTHSQDYVAFIDVLGGNTVARFLTSWSHMTCQIIIVCFV